MVDVPDGVLIVVVGCLGGLLGFLGRTVMDHRTRIAVLEASDKGIKALEAKVDELRTDMADLKATIRERFK